MQLCAGETDGVHFLVHEVAESSGHYKASLAIMLPVQWCTVKIAQNVHCADRRQCNGVTLRGHNLDILIGRLLCNLTREAEGA